MLPKRLRAFAKPSEPKAWMYFLAIAATFIFFVIGARYVDYPDEYVNVLAGQRILDGALPYRDYWDHHLPGAWYIASAILVFAGKSFALFRLIYALVVFASFAALAKWMYRRSREIFPYYLAFMTLYPLAGLYFWFHLYLADSLAIWFFSLSFWILFVLTHESKQTLRSLALTSVLVFLMIFCSTSYLYMGLGLYGWICYLAFRISSGRKRISAGLKLIGAFAAPYLVWAAYLALTGTLDDMYFANFVYNTKYYISINNFDRSGGFNPIKFPLVLAANFYEGYLPLLSKIKHFDLYLPIHTMAALGTLTLLILLLQRSLILGAFFLVIMTFSAPRSDIQVYKETDYQVSMFLIVGAASAMMALYLLRTIERRDLSDDLKRATRFVLGVFALFTLVFLLVNAYSKAHQMYIQKLPMIANRGFIAESINEILEPGQTSFIGPYEPQEFFYLNTRFAGRHPSLLPQFREGDELRASFLADIERQNPALVVYRQEASVFGTPSLEFGAFFLEWMQSRYTRLEKVPGIEVLRNPTNANLRSDLYLRNDIKENLLQTMQAKGFITINPVEKDEKNPK